MWAWGVVDLTLEPICPVNILPQGSERFGGVKPIRAAGEQANLPPQSNVVGLQWGSGTCTFNYSM